MDQLAPTAKYSPYRFFYRRANGQSFGADTPLTLTAGRGRAAALAERPDRPRRGPAHLSVAVAAALGPCRGQPAAVSPAPALSSMSDDGTKTPFIIGIAGSVAVGKSTTARILQGTADALAVEPEGRSRHHRRLPLPQRGAAPRQPDGAQGLSRQLRHRRAAALPLGASSPASPTSRAGLFAPDL